ncbi:amino acid adenylation domain-containing protein [Streptomyces sp. NPDC058457]|uniref:amino acid adenylation domain-containing protein n=1 Tax=Streptomyces sp. NPDC058457 TaxID=3346507 RepID=UPI00364A1224
MESDSWDEETSQAGQGSGAPDAGGPPRTDSRQIAPELRRLLAEVRPDQAPELPEGSLRAWGLSSLALTRLLLGMRRAFGVNDLDIAALADADLKNLQELVGRAESREGAREPQSAPQLGDDEADFSLTFLQEAYVVAKQEGAADPAGCHLYREFRVAWLDPARLEKAWLAVVRRHDMLRTLVGQDGTQRTLADPPPWQLPVHDLTELDEATGVRSVTDIRERLSHRCYRPDAWPLFAVEASLLPGGVGIIHLSLDTVVTDAHGFALVLQQWKAEYEGRGVVDGRDERADDAVTVASCVRSLLAERTGPRHAEDLDYWVRLGEVASGPPDIVLEPAAHASGPGDAQEQVPRMRRPLDGALDAAAWRRLTRLADEWDVSPTALVLTCFTESLVRAGAKAPFTLLLTSSDRPRLPRAADELVGPFTSTLVHEVTYMDQPSPAEAARTANRLLGEQLRHGGVSGVEAARAVRAASGRQPAALPVVFTSLIDVGPGEGVAGGFGADTVYGVSQTSGVALDHQMWVQDGGLRFRWDVDDTRFATGTADTAFAAFRTALSALGPAATDKREGTEGSGRWIELPPRDLQQAYMVGRTVTEAAAEAEGCQCYQSYEVEALDLVRLHGALRRLVERHDALRTQTDGARLRVRPRGTGTVHIPFIDLGADADANEGDLARIRTEMTSRPFPLDRWPLVDVRVTRDHAGRHTAHCAMDLLVGDGRSIHLLFRELWRLYADENGPAGPELATAPADTDRYVPGGRRGRAAAHWRERLAAMPPGPVLPRADVVGRGGGRRRLTGTFTGYRELARRAAVRGVAVDDILFAALTAALSEEITDPYALSVVLWPEQSERHRPAEESFLDWLPAPPRGTPLQEAARSARLQITADLAHRCASGLAELSRRALRDRSVALSYPVVLTALVDLTRHPLPQGVTQGKWLTSTPGCDLDVVCVAEADTLSYAWDLAPGVLGGGLDEKLFALFEAGVRAWSAEAAEEERAIADEAVVVATGAEREAVLYGWNVTEASPAPALEGPIQLPFEHWARVSPAAVAVRGRSGSTVGYGELNRRANTVAWRLRAEGVEAGDVVAVRMARGPALVAALYGVLKAGAAYLPVDTALPAARVSAMLRAAGVRTLLTAPGTVPLDPPVAHPVRRVVVDPGPDAEAHPQAGENPAPVACADDTAYVLFTSGSTGTPKGVAVAHRSVHNLIAFCARDFDLVPHDTGLALTSFGFDLSVFDLFGLLGHGASIYLADEEEQRDPQLLADVLLNEPVTIWNSAPTTLHQLTPFLPDADGGRLRLALLSGDFVPLSLPGRLAAAFPGVRTIALGGPTETTVWSNVFHVRDIDPEWRAIPYGRPVDRCRHYVLDSRLRPCPPGTEGDLYTAGRCLALGYAGDPELTMASFPPDPYTDEPGARMFRTGDRALWDADGCLHIRGRTDGRVKIRGQRVELAEVEHVLRTDGSVRDVVVSVREQEGDQLLVAHVIPAEEGSGDEGALRERAAKALPSYMVPNFVVFVPSFPATAHGKLDRSALPLPVPERTTEPPEPEEDQPEELPLVEEIAAVFAEILGVPAIDTAADLWDQGVTSFTLVQVSARLLRRYGQRVPVAALVADLTVGGIARVVGRRIGRAGPAKTATDTGPDTARAPATGPVTGTRVAAPGPGHAPEQVDLFSPEERDAFKAARWNLRPADVREPAVELPRHDMDPVWYAWRGSRRDFLDEPLPSESLARLLALLSDSGGNGAHRRLHASAGDTYAVQTYLHVRERGVEGIPEGIYYHHPVDRRLHLVNSAPRITRNVHFPYNRPVFDRSGFGIYLIGQTKGITPLYGEAAENFLLLEAGYIGQLLMTGQAGCRVGLCPVGTMTFDTVRDQFALDDGHVFLHALMGGPVAHERADRAPFTAGWTDEAAVAPTGKRVSALGPAPAPVGRRQDDTAQVVVSGMAGRFPGAESTAAYWRRLSSGHCATGLVPEDRREALAAAAPGRPGVTSGGFLHRPDRFDARRFRLSPAEAATLDPQARLLLETVWNCLEDSGHTPASLAGEAPRVGVFTATMWHDQQLVGADAWAGGAPALSSALASDLPARISHFFGFEGPSLAVDTSCSSSLTALHLAAESLRRGECDAAVVGAANLILHPYHLAALSAAGLLTDSAAPVRAYAADSSGWCPGEGVAAVLLRPAEPARRAGDVVHGVLEATWVGHYGGRGRYGSPAPNALAASLRTVLDRAGATPADIGYVECAAAGAALADVAELEALADVFASSPLLIGTVKPNIGHLEGASGLSQLIKVLLQLRHRSIAPTLVAGHRTPLVDWDGLPLRIADRLTNWRARGGDPGAVRRALVNAVGAAGSYAHVVLRGPGAEEEW